ncbi:hypothetical protein M902_0390 [Bacteriovorax sp. BAL6_X]|uniref:hypothetical protein n=1 Tax=Bacteriovorax sp. BAL6_X TaxID=1201290 RepID=UPI0003861220|nr:hypothetical protein [Bacteriovorax sp. BAL6_X]EPZ49446.1 hypothetical protein M902_0390 [Bacteriovorax sp. BAL6_X]
MSNKITSYNMRTVRFPDMICSIKDQGNDLSNWAPAYRAGATIDEEGRVVILFGVQLTNVVGEDKKIGNSLVQAECRADFTLNGEVPLGLTKLNEIPLVANMIASMFPFVREKLHGMLYSNMVTFIIPSYNLVNYVRDVGQNIEITDLRTKPLLDKNEGN